MPYFLEIPLASGETILANVTEQVDEVAPFASGKEVIGRLTRSFGHELDHVRSFAGEVVSHLRESAEPPDRVAVEFGLQLTAKAGVVIAEVAGDAHITVTVEWNKSADHSTGTA